MIFVNSMSDLFHKGVPVAFVEDVFAVMAEASWHTFQVLTKRADRLAELAPDLTWPPNVWMGVSVETERDLWRADRLRPLPLHRAALGPDQGDRPRPGRLGDRRGRERRWRQASEPRVGEDHPRHLPPVRGTLLLQAMGRRAKGKGGKEADGRTWDEKPATIAGEAILWR
jgi:protein gp37